jgi:hypothetical protein
MITPMCLALLYTHRATRLAPNGGRTLLLDIIAVPACR